MILFSWLAVPVLMGGAVLLAAFWLRQRFRVPWVMLAVAAGFSLLSLLAAVIVLAVVHAASIRDGVVFSMVLVPAVSALCAETVRYLSFRAGRSMRAHRTSGGALMPGLGHGGMNAIIGWVVHMMHDGALPSSWVHAGPLFLGFAVGFVVLGCGLAVITELGLATLVVLAYRRSRLFLPLAVLAHFAVNASLRALVVHGGLWALALSACWAAAAMVLVVLVHRSGWLKVAPQDETAAIVV